VDLVNKDNLRMNNLIRGGWRVMKFTGHAINNNLDQCIKSFIQGCIVPPHETDSIPCCESEFDPRLTDESYRKRIIASY
jgi:hypothetical protein